MFGDIVQDVKTDVESVVSAKIGEQTESLEGLLSGCAKETSVRGESDALKVLLSGIEMRFREEHAVLIEAINVNTAATKVQTGLLEALYNEAKTMNGKIDVLCSHSARLQNVERDVATIANSVKTVEDKAGVVSTHVSSLNERVDDIRLAFNDKIRAIKTLAKQDVIMARGISALKSWTDKASATITYDSRVDPFTNQGLFDKINGKENIALVAFTAEGDVFGGFYSVAVTVQDKAFNDPNMFIFSFESHGRCETPQRFAVKNEVRSSKYMRFWKKNSVFVDVGGSCGFFYLGNEKSNTYCYDLSDGYEGIKDDTLTGKAYPERFTCTHIVAVHLQ